MVTERTVASLKVVTREGEEITLPGKDGLSVMEIIRSEGIYELLALCGGHRSCATCHIHVDPAFVDRLPTMSEAEGDLLDSSAHRNERSRLSCQVVFRDAFDGLRVTIAPEE
jgi:ferredoxin, 2Fe-2S